MILMEGKDILSLSIIYSDLRKAGSEVSALLGRMPSTVGYQPTFIGNRNGSDAGTYHYNQAWFDYFWYRQYMYLRMT